MKITLLPALLLAALLPLSTSFAQILSNGTGGGNWTDVATWIGGVPPVNSSFNVVSGDVVTASGITLNSVAGTTYFAGTLNLDSGSVFSLRRVSGLWNVNGATLNIQRWDGSSASTLTIGSAGFVRQTDISSASANVLVQTGGTWTTTNSSAHNAVESLAGGTIIQENATKRGLDTWSSGTVIINGGTIDTSNQSGLLGKMNSPNHTLQMSNRLTAQTLSFTAGGGGISAGNLVFGMYSATPNDNDRMMTTATADFNLGSAVNLSLVNAVLLGGNAMDYLGVTYKLFDDPVDYNDIQPSLVPTVWNIGGLEYDITFTNTLSIDGSLTVSGVTIIPEPSTLSLIGGALAALAMARRRR